MKKIFFALAVLLVGVLPGLAPVWGQTLEEKVREHVLPNGLKLLVVERHESPTVAAYVTMGVGSVHETSKSRGVAHLLEHMLFKGTETIGTRDYRREKSILEAIERVGSRLDELKNRPDADPLEIDKLRKELAGLHEEHKKYVIKDELSQIYAEHGGVGFNAFTSKDLTTYLVSLPANKLELWAAVESDRMRRPVLREYYTEREVVMEERRRSYETSPGGILYENLLATAFTMHPYRNPIIGWMSDLETLSLAETREFLRKYYAPVNTVIALVGDIEADRAIALVERYFGDIPPGVPAPPVTAKEPPQAGEKRIAIRFDAEPQLSIAFHKPTLPSREDYVFDLIDLILSQGRASRLYRSLVVEKGLAASVSTSSAPGSRYPNLFVVSAVPRYPHTLAEVEAAILAELDLLAQEPVRPEELEKARTRLRTDRLRYLQGNDGLARMLSYYQTVAGDWRYIVTYDDKVAALTAEDVQEVARRFFTPANRTVATISRGGE